VAPGGIFASIPDATVCFEGARFEQHLSVELAEGASACVVDLLHAGRVSRGERWAMATYRNQLTFAREGVTTIRDALHLDPAHGSIAERMGRFDALATIVLAAAAFAAARARIGAELAAQPVRGELLNACSERADLLLVRFAAPDASSAHARLRTLLTEVSAIVGDVLARKR
jgi:urease accessory protein